VPKDPKQEPLDETWEVWVNTLLANPTGPPTVALAIGAFFGFRFVAPKLNLAFKTAADVADDVIKAAEDIVKEKIVEPLVPVSTFASDIKACYNSAVVNLPWGGQGWVPGYSEPRFTLCMLQKGYGGDVVAEALRKL